MDPTRFDRLTKLLATGGSRRALLARLTGGTLGLALAGQAGTARARRIGSGPGDCAPTGRACKAASDCCGKAVCAAGWCIPEDCVTCVVYHQIACEYGTCRPQCASDQLPNFDCDDCVRACVASNCGGHCQPG